MLTTLQYADFFNIITVAIGINLTYIIIDTKRIEERKKFAFFGFLSTVADGLLSSAKYFKLKGQSKEEAKQAMLGYYCKSGKLKEETKGAFKLLLRTIKKSLDRLEKEEARVRRFISASCKAENLSKIALVCALYGIFVLFMGGIQYKCSDYVNIEPGLFFFNIAILILLGHCLLWKKRTIQFWQESKKYKNYKFCQFINRIFYWLGKILAPRFITYIILYFIIAWYSLSIVFSEATSVNGIYNQIIGRNSHINLFSTLLVCFSGFIVYTIVALLFSIIFLIRFLINLRSMKIKAEIKEIEEKMDYYKDELEQIDKDMNSSLNEDKFK